MYPIQSMSNNDLVGGNHYEKRISCGIHRSEIIKLINDGFHNVIYRKNDWRVFKIPLDPRQSACTKLKNKFDDLDTYMLDNKRQLLSELPPRDYEYQPIVRRFNNEELININNYDKFYTKAKCEMLSYPSIVVHYDNSSFELIDKSCLTRLASIDEIKKKFSYGCNFICELSPTKIWAIKLNNKYKYGLNLDCIKLSVMEN